jgi:hypothetical protein
MGRKSGVASVASWGFRRRVWRGDQPRCGARKAADFIALSRRT